MVIRCTLPLLAAEVTFTEQSELLVVTPAPAAPPSEVHPPGNLGPV